MQNNEDLPRTVLADVPFGFDNQRTRAASGGHYRVMTVDEIKSYVFLHNTKSCLLLFWSWNAVLPQCLEIINAWGFTYKTKITWIKPHMGLGNYVRNASEDLLIAIKGRVRRKDPAKRLLSWFIAEPREHSRKPEYQYDIAEMLGEPPYLELFARRHRDGWQSDGDELE